jgi:hypothetical protein
VIVRIVRLEFANGGETAFHAAMNQSADSITPAASVEKLLFIIQGPASCLLCLGTEEGESIAPSTEHCGGELGAMFKINKIFMALLQRYTEEIYGMELRVFSANQINSNQVAFIYTEWSSYSVIIPLCLKLKLVVLVIAPLWIQHEWFGMLTKFCTHTWSIPSPNDVLQSAVHDNCEVLACLADFRFSPLETVVHANIPSITECIAFLRKRSHITRKLSKADVTLPLDKLKSPFNIQFLAEVSIGTVTDELRDIVINSMKNGFSSLYRGGSSFQRDFSSSLPPDKYKLAIEKMEKEVTKGYCIGPFKECPFPNEWCSSQAIICQIFFRPKHRFVDDGEFRLIGNKSFPIGRSFNDLVPRRDCKSFISNYEYFTFSKFLSLVQTLGKNTLISHFDVCDAYKNCKMKPKALWQQVYKCNDLYYVDLGGTFGSRNAGDAWNLVMELIIASMKKWCGVEFLYYYVDNALNLYIQFQIILKLKDHMKLLSSS